ncbi:MAG TPA: hypothetical protein VMU02_00755, partial [bacterium]|nr:hypothetical protein [bacterium]
MWNPFRISGFERRLVISFLLFSVIPVAIIAFISTRYFMKSVRLVSNPAVEQSFRNSMEIARDFSLKLGEDAGCASKRLAEALEARPQASTADLLATMRTVSEETHVDFAAIYDLEGETWKCRLTYPPDVPRIEQTIGMSALETSEQAAAMAHPGGTGTSGSQPGPPIPAQLDTQSGGLESHRIAFKDPDLVAAGVVTKNSLVVVGFTLNAG